MVVATYYCEVNHSNCLSLLHYIAFTIDFDTSAGHQCSDVFHKQMDSKRLLIVQKIQSLRDQKRHSRCIGEARESALFSKLNILFFKMPRKV